MSKTLATTAVQAAKDVHAAATKYTFINPKLKDNSYRTGDAYDDETSQRMRAMWDL